MNKKKKDNFIIQKFLKLKEFFTFNCLSNIQLFLDKLSKINYMKLYESVHYFFTVGTKLLKESINGV